METTAPISKGRKWTSYILQTLISLLFIMGGIGNLAGTETAVNGATQLGYLESHVFYLGIVLFLSSLLYLIPKTNILGAVLLTAWLGGAVATHIINLDPIVNSVFPLLFGVLVWFSLWLRNDKLRKLLPFN